MAEFKIAELPKNLIVRPSGVWDTRAPFHYFLAIFKRENRARVITTLSYFQTESALNKARSEGVPIKDFFIQQCGIQAKRPWRSYEKYQTERSSDGVIKSPIFSNAKSDLYAGQSLMSRGSVVSNYTLFETYLQSWLLNYLLAKLENGHALSEKELNFSIQLSPIHGSKKSLNLAEMINGIELINKTLKNYDPDGISWADSKFTTRSFSLYDSVKFWRQFRNAVVHARGFCPPKLFEQQQKYWNECMGKFKRDAFIERTRLPLSQELLIHCQTCIYKSAKILDESLVSFSNGKRGHPFAPETPQTDSTFTPKFANKLLLNGDHAISLQWHTDSAFRDKYKIIIPSHIPAILPTHFKQRIANLS
jgi:hypothetical protein